MITRATLLSICLAIICVILVSIVPISYSYFLENRTSKSFEVSPKNPLVTGSTASRIIARVAQAEKIPKDEIPTVILITDISALSSFGSVKRGDYVLLYHKAGLGVVFDEVTDQIINAVPVNIKNPNEQ